MPVLSELTDICFIRRAVKKLTLKYEFGNSTPCFTLQPTHRVAVYNVPHTLYSVFTALWYSGDISLSGIFIVWFPTFSGLNSG